MSKETRHVRPHTPGDATTRGPYAPTVGWEGALAFEERRRLRNRVAELEATLSDLLRGIVALIHSTGVHEIRVARKTMEETERGWSLHSETDIADGSLIIRIRKSQP